MVHNQEGTLLYILTVLIFVISSIHCHEYHIIPSSSDPCPIRSYFTLSELTNNISNYLNSDNITLVFLPRDHSLETELRISDVHSLKLEKSNISLRTMIIIM